MSYECLWGRIIKFRISPSVTLKCERVFFIFFCVDSFGSVSIIPFCVLYVVDFLRFFLLGRAHFMYCLFRIMFVVSYDSYTYMAIFEVLVIWSHAHLGYISVAVQSR